MLKALSPCDANTRNRSGSLQEGFGQSGFSNASLTGYKHDLPLPGKRQFPPGPQSG
jgi:hypothetical protein